MASTIEDEIAVSDTKADIGSLSKTVADTKSEDLQLHAPETVGLESIEAVSGRLVSDSFYSCLYDFIHTWLGIIMQLL